jgi:hypothetical protein
VRVERRAVVELAEDLVRLGLGEYRQA